MLHNRRVNNGNLSEELEALGFSSNGEDLARMATQRLDEAIYGGAIVSAVPIGAEPEETVADGAVSDEVDPIDGPYVTMELLDRLEGLELDGARLEDVQELLAGLEAKIMPEGLSEADATILDERFKKMVNKFGKIIKKKVLTGVAKLKGKKSRRKNRASIKKSSRKYAKKGGKILKRIKAKFAGRSAKARLRIADIDSPTSALAEELRSMLDESAITPTGYDELMERFCSVFDLIEWHLEDEAVGQVLEDAVFDLWSGIVTESVDDTEFTERCRPVLSLMAHCLRRIEGEEPQGN